MSYVLGTLKAKVLEDLTIRAELTNLELREGSRPRRAGEFGAIPEQIERLNTRVSGQTIETPVRLGVGVVIEPELSGRYWSISDGELLRDGTPLNRSIHVVFQRLPVAPLMVRLGPNGICDFGIVLEGENLQLCTNQKSRAALSRLGYLAV